MQKEQQSKTDFSQLKRLESTQITAIVFSDLHKMTRPSGCAEIDVSAHEKKWKKICQLINELNKKWTPKLRTIRENQRNTLQTLEEIAKRSTEYCQELFKNSDTNVNAELTSLREISPKQNPSTINDQFLKSEIHVAINTMEPP